MKTTNFNALKRKWICILFLVLFMAGGMSLVGMSANDTTAINKGKTQSHDEHEEKIKFIKVEKIKPVPYLKKLLIF